MLKLFNIGKERGIESLIDIGSRLTEIFEERKKGIFRSIYMWETIRHVKYSKKSKFHSNESYKLNDEIYDKMTIFDLYTDYYTAGLKGDKRDPIEAITEEKSEKKIIKSEESDILDFGPVSPKTEIEDIWDVTDLTMNLNFFKFDLSENFMFAVLIKAFGIEGPDVRRY